ncbi:urease accessory protein UreD [Salinisphaera hydrothermalis]|uniref:Urease accessory protein UreD n=1 Tax=Salinisphaera hydrothermalis (strain C41B8) TaxID=1304275 RepID=A0A084IRI0_SALHC|nr:urease accessory protein UreD [Salinisphaera hydrothermalis]KEZ79314.1 urease accessory protein UreD [Salinisphaera hydrothermalis C41B8]
MIVSTVDIQPDSPSLEFGWRARLDLTIARRGERSVAVRRRHVGPVYIQRPLYPELDGTAHVMLLHPPGGVVQGDEIVFSVAVEPGAQALITTPSAAKLYRSPDRASRQSVQLCVGRGSSLEWLPQEAIVFDGARAQTSLDLDLAADARAIAWDVWMLGRPASGESFQHGRYDGRLNVRLDGRLLWHERTGVPGAGDSPMLDATWGMGGARAMGTLVAYRPEGFDEATVTDVRSVLAVYDLAVGVSAVDGLLVVRVTAREAHEIQPPLRNLWVWLRPLVYDKSAVAPRIWAT